MAPHPQLVYNNNSSNINGIDVSSSSVVHADDIVLGGSSLSKTIKKIQERLLILEPKKEHLERHEMLRRAYEEYLILEQLLLEENS